MSKYQVPFKTTKYKIITPKVSDEQVKCALLDMMVYLKEQQNHYFTNDLDQLVSKFMDEKTSLSGSLNSLGRKLGIEPRTKAVYQAYNMSEMFRTLILGKTAGYLQNEAILGVVNNLGKEPISITPKEVVDEYKRVYPYLKPPSFMLVKKTLGRLVNGVLHGIPQGDKVLPLWACDTHYCKLSQTGRELYLSIPFKDMGRITLSFTLPKSERFQGIKTSRPTVILNHKGQITFAFSIQKEVPKPTPTESVMGIDLGLVQPFTGTVIANGTYSQPIHPNHKVVHYQGKVQHLKKHSTSLWSKEVLNQARGHNNKAEVLKVERLRVRSKISRLKVELSYAVSNQIVQIAQEANANIILEDLSWVPQSKWDHSRTQDTITHKARTKGIRTRKVNPKNTSQNCPTCGGKVTHSKRRSYCLVCSKGLDRDILASRNIALRALRLKVLPKHYSQLSLHTRVTRPVTPGSNVINSTIQTLQNVKNTT